MSTQATNPTLRPGMPATATCQPLTAGAMIRTMVWITGAGLLAISLAALVVDAAFAGTVRGWLDYPFSGIPAHASSRSPSPATATSCPTGCDAAARPAASVNDRGEVTPA